ncbi:MAG TPA: lasso RiPP family leader peptide-containing protein [Leptolyngbyaceae cyanobacterium]
MRSNNQTPKKKAYHSPTLVAYGDIREMTQGGNGRSNIDSPANPQNPTFKSGG